MENNLKLAFTSEKEVTVDDIVNEGDAMYKYVKTRFGKCTSEQLHKEITQAHPQFSKSYPLVVRYMCDMKQYSSRALRLWINKIKNTPWKSEVEYIEAQADYVYKLVCDKNPRASETDKRAVKQNLRKLLMKEHDDFKNSAKIAEKTVSAREDALNDRNMDELYLFLQKFTLADIDSIGTFRVETELESAARARIDEIIMSAAIDVPVCMSSSKKLLDI